MFTTRKGLLVIILILIFTGGYHLPDFNLFPSDQKDITISDERRTHILQGDDKGGGHAFGTGRPCKSEFPKEWSNDEIIKHVRSIAANDNLDWEKQDNGYYTAIQMVEGVRVRVVLNRRRDDVITAYPLNQGRNPCPRNIPANDN